MSPEMLKFSIQWLMRLSVGGSAMYLVDFGGVGGGGERTGFLVKENHLDCCRKCVCGGRVCAV